MQTTLDPILASFQQHCADLLQGATIQMIQSIPVVDPRDLAQCQQLIDQHDRLRAAVEIFEFPRLVFRHPQNQTIAWAIVPGSDRLENIQFTSQPCV